LEIEGKPSMNVTSKEPLDLATMRTILAADRTLMAWIRTSFTLLGFGFTIYAILLVAGFLFRQLARVGRETKL
jgi:uncharacterized membrane protein YidH (DUF202 family)